MHSSAFLEFCHYCTFYFLMGEDLNREGLMVDAKRALETANGEGGTSARLSVEGSCTPDWRRLVFAITF